MKLLTVSHANDGVHKYEAEFDDGKGHRRITKFGARGMDDYTLTHDKEQRDRYRKRHSKDLQTDDVTRAGYLSYYILWGESTNLLENIREYKRRFNL
jgi:hypothetical protein